MQLMIKAINLSCHMIFIYINFQFFIHTWKNLEVSLMPLFLLLLNAIEILHNITVIEVDREIVR